MLNSNNAPTSPQEPLEASGTSDSPEEPGEAQKGSESLLEAQAEASLAAWFLFGYLHF